MQKKEKNKIREIKSKVKVREIKSKVKIKEIKKKGLIKINEGIEEVVNESELNRFFQTTKAPVLEKIAHVREPNLEQIAFTQSREKKVKEEGMGYLDIKSDYANMQGGKENKGVSSNYDAPGDKGNQENTYMAHEFDKEGKEKRKREDWRFGSEGESWRFESQEKKYATGKI
ncbi:MAG: hypothetical protein IIA85_02475 [Nanoarchaeota archaeon]|nr:hypothetical protein [Nanoarchaeota archaeon]